MVLPCIGLGLPFLYLLVYVPVVCILVLVDLCKNRLEECGMSHTLFVNFSRHSTSVTSS